jgi:hypothetical protein
MELVIIFFIVRIVGNAWDAKVGEFRATEKATRKRINAQFPNATKERREQMVRNSNRRRAAGYGAYQLRHGWPSLWTAIHDGWGDAREGHEAWSRRQAEAGEKPSMGDAAREAWHGRKPRPEPADEEPPFPQWDGDWPKPEPKPQTPEQVDPAPKATDDPKPAPAGRDAEIIPIRPTPTGDTVEAPNIEAARQAAAAEATQLGARVSGWEQLTADLIAGGMGKDRQTMALAAQVQEHLANAQAAAAAFVASLNKHAAGEEYAATGHAAKTEFLQPS